MGVCISFTINKKEVVASCNKDIEMMEKYAFFMI